MQAAKGKLMGVSSNPRLSTREREVLALIADGLTNQAIASRLCLSLHTVKWHVRRLLQRFEAASRAQLVAKALQSDL